jgi:phosphoglycolate phosphatase
MPNLLRSAMTLRGILLDKDGTLIDFDGTWGPAAYEVMRTLACGDERKFMRLVEVSEYLLDERRFLPTSPLIVGSSAEYGPDWADVLGRPDTPDLYREMDTLFLRFGLQSIAPIGEPAAVAHALRARGLRLGIATNDAEASARAQANALGLDGHLDFIAGYDSGFGGKPAPGMVLGFAEAIGAPPETIALIGDSLHDLSAARAAGSIAVLVLTGPLGGAARTELAPHADHVIGSIADLPALVESLRATSSPSRSPIS